MAIAEHAVILFFRAFSGRLLLEQMHDFKLLYCRCNASQIIAHTWKLMEAPSLGRMKNK